MQQTTNIQKKSMDAITDNKTWAAILWIMACFTTALFVSQLGIAWEYATIVAVVLQGAISKIEQTVWRGSYTPIGIIVLLFDVYINSAGIWPWVKTNFVNTDAWKMAADLTDNSTPPDMWFLLFLTLAAGFVLARGPEYLYNYTPKK